MRSNAALLTRDNPVALERREAIPRPTTFNDEANTIEAVIASTTPVRRRDQRGEFMEVLDPAGLDLATTRGASVLDSHMQGTLDNQLGALDDVWVEGDQVIARIRFSENPKWQPVIADIAAGIIRNLSVGYEVAEWRDGKDASGQRTRTAARWSVREASFVPVPADPAARTRSREPVGDRAVQNRTIRELARRAGASQNVVDDLIDRSATIDQARAALMFDMLDRNVNVRTGRDHNALTLDNPEVYQRAVGEALYVRAAPNHRPAEPARAFIGLTIPDIAREVLRRNNINTTGMGADALITRALHTTSDFSLILADTVGRSMRAAYQAAPAGIRQLGRETTANDFRKKSRLQLDASGFTLEKVNESGEFKSGTMAEASESYAVDSYGRIFGISRKALVNDDVGAFTDLSRRVGQAASAFEAQFLVNLLISNAGNGPNLSDNKALFHTDHGNLAAVAVDWTGSNPPTLYGLDAARLAMRKQTGPGGGLITVTPRFVLVPAELETIGEKILTAIQATKIGDVNPFTRLSLIVEPRLTSAKRWYVVASPDEIDGLEFAYLAGAPGPQIESRAGFEVDGVQVKVRLDFGAGFVDHRGWYTNAGQ